MADLPNNELNISDNSNSGQTTTADATKASAAARDVIGERLAALETGLKDLGARLDAWIKSPQKAAIDPAELDALRAEMRGSLTQEETDRVRLFMERYFQHG